MLEKLIFSKLLKLNLTNFFFQTFFSLNRFSQPIRQDRNHNEGDIMIYVRGVIPRKKNLNL